MNLISDNILEILKDNLDGRGIRTFRLGNPIDIGKTTLPMIYVQPLEERVETLDTAHDTKIMDFQIGVLVDPATEYKKSKKGVVENAGDRWLMEIISGRNDDGSPMTDTISYVLRNNWTMEGVVFYQESRTVYGVREVPDAYYAEVHFFITARASVVNFS